MKDVTTREFLCSTVWQKKRERILKRDGYQCQQSKRLGKRVKADMVHHVFPRHEFPQYALSDWNLISLSYAQHNKLHTEGGSLTDEGKQLLRRIALKNRIEIPARYK